MAAARFYSSTAGAIDLTGSITSSATSMTVSSTTGLPGTVPFTLVLDPSTPSEEIVTVTNVSGLTLTIARGVDGSSATAHSASVGNVRHMATARDFREPQEHIGATADVHGIGASSSVVGTDTVQNLKNKTALAASAATVGLIAKGAAAQTASHFEVQDSTGAVVAKVKPGEGSLTVGGALVNAGGVDSLFGYVAKFTAGAATVVSGIFKAAASQTADILQIQNSAGTALAKFDKDGKLTTPEVISTGAVSGTTGSFSGAVTSPTITTLTAADTALDGRLDMIEANLGAQTTFAATSAAKDGKKTHWAAYAIGATGGSSVTVTHSAGFTPTAVALTTSVPGLLVAVSNITATTFDASARVHDGTLYGTAYTLHAFLGE